MSMESLDLKSNGIVFHSLGAATAKALSPYVLSLAFGVAKSCWEDDLKMRHKIAIKIAPLTVFIP